MHQSLVYLPTTPMLIIPSEVDSILLIFIQRLKSGFLSTFKFAAIIAHRGLVCDKISELDKLNYNQSFYNRFCVNIAKQAILDFCSSGIMFSVLHKRISGCMPIPCNSFTECWVGLVFSSPAVLI